MVKHEPELHREECGPDADRNAADRSCASQKLCRKCFWLVAMVGAASENRTRDLHITSREHSVRLWWG